MKQEIIFTRHANLQIIERKIAKVEVLRVVINPDSIVPEEEDKFRAMKLVKRNNKSYLLVVIYRQTDAYKKIITVFLTSKIKKYFFK